MKIQFDFENIFEYFTNCTCFDAVLQRLLAITQHLVKIPGDSVHGQAVAHHLLKLVGVVKVHHLNLTLTLVRHVSIQELCHFQHEVLLDFAVHL